MSLRRLVVAALFALLAPLSTASAGQFATYDDVVAGLQKGNIVLVDVREADEFTAGHVPGAINLPLSGLTPAAVPHPADKTVVVMCRSGNRSGKATALLAAAGRTDIVDYSGSMNDWAQRGGPTVAGK